MRFPKGWISSKLRGRPCRRGAPSGPRRRSKRDGRAVGAGEVKEGVRRHHAGEAVTPAAGIEPVGKFVGFVETLTVRSLLQNPAAFATASRSSGSQGFSEVKRTGAPVHAAARPFFIKGDDEAPQVFGRALRLHDEDRLARGRNFDGRVGTLGPAEVLPQRLCVCPPTITSMPATDRASSRSAGSQCG